MRKCKYIIILLLNTEFCSMELQTFYLYKNHLKTSNSHYLTQDSLI